MIWCGVTVNQLSVCVKSGIEQFVFNVSGNKSAWAEIYGAGAD